MSWIQGYVNESIDYGAISHVALARLVWWIGTCMASLETYFHLRKSLKARTSTVSKSRKNTWQSDKCTASKWDQFFSLMGNVNFLVQVVLKLSSMRDIHYEFLKKKGMLNLIEKHSGSLKKQFGRTLLRQHVVFFRIYIGDVLYSAKDNVPVYAKMSPYFFFYYLLKHILLN